MRPVPLKGMPLALAVLALAATTAASTEPQKPCCAPEAADASSPVPLSKLSVYQLGSTWYDDGGKPMTLGSLSGRPVVLAMFYTSCENACPIIVGEMKRILDALPDASRTRPRLVLVSFDSDHDSPAILRLYRARMGLGSEYVLLHGQPDEVRGLAMVLGVNYAKDARGQFAHSNLITILNPAGEIAFQRPGLAGDISAAVNALALAAR